MENSINEIKKVVCKSEGEREVWVCIATQKIGSASIEAILDKIDTWNGKMTDKQAQKCAENLRARGILSIDLSEKDENGISIKKYKMKSIKFSVPEIAQIKDVVDNEELKPLIEELDRSKNIRKKGMKSFDYYIAEVAFKTKGLVQGFQPNEEGLVKHYRDAEGTVTLYSYHFKNWFRANLPLINRAANSIGDIKFCDGEIAPNGELPIIEKFITNIDSGFHSSHGTGGRGSRKIECLPEGTIVKTSFAVPRELIAPDKFQKALELFGKYGSGFGGGAKLSTGRLIPEAVEIVNEELFGED